jgi:hypothetical protein
MINEQDIFELLIQSIEQQIDSLEDTSHDKAVHGEPKLLLSDNVTENGKIHIRSSLMNKHFHLSFLIYKDFLHRYVKGHLNN